MSPMKDFASEPGGIVAASVGGGRRRVLDRSGISSFVDYEARRDMVRS